MLSKMEDLCDIVDFGKKKVEVCAWGVLGLLSILYFFLLYYMDIYITYDNSLILMDCIRSGRIFDFYEISMQQNIMETGAVYFIPIYIIFLIWNLPIWFLTRFFGISIDNMGCLLWSKGLVVLFTVGSVWLLYRIFKKIQYNNFEYAVFLFLSSLFFVCPSLAVCQYDIIEIFFMLYGIFFYCQDERLSRRSLLLFSVAVSIKLFVLFPLIVLILITEKKILDILWNIIYVLLPSVIVMLPWYNGYKQATASFNQDMIQRLFSIILPGGIANISIFSFCFFVICIIAYLSKTQKFQECFRLFVWLSFAFFLIFFSTVLANPYWIILFLPYIVFLLMDNEKNMRVNMILEIIMEGTMILVQGTYFYWVYFNEEAFSHLVLKNPIIQEGFTNIGDILTKLGLYLMVPGFYAAFVACGLALLLINNPWKSYSEEITGEECIIVEKMTRCLRVSLVAIYIVLTYVVAYH